MDKIQYIKETHSGNFFLIAGPCVVENKEITYRIASEIKSLAEKFSIPFIFKASYTKANRTSKDGFRGVGISAGLAQLAKIKTDLKNKSHENFKKYN